MVGVSSYSSEAIGSLLGALKFELEFLAFTCTHSLSGTCIFIGEPLLQHILTPGGKAFSRTPIAAALDISHLFGS